MSFTAEMEQGDEDFASARSESSSLSVGHDNQASHASMQDDVTRTTTLELGGLERNKEIDGTLVEFTEQDPDDPRNWSWSLRFTIIAVLSFNAWILSMLASVYLFISSDLQRIYSTSDSLASLGFVVYILGWGPGPLILAPLSDTIGRKPVYVGSVFCWTLFVSSQCGSRKIYTMALIGNRPHVYQNVGCARSTSMTSIIVCRFFAGLLGSASIVCGGGTTVDIWTGLDMARSVSLYSALVYLGPVCGPIIGAAISQYATPIDSSSGGWRWAFYAAIASGVVCTIAHMIIPETHHNTILARRARKLRIQYPSRSFYTALEKQGVIPLQTKISNVGTGAIKMVASEPIVVFVSLWQTTVSAILYLFFDAFPIVYGRDHGFTTIQVGLSFLGVGVGMLIASVYSITWNLHVWAQDVAKQGRKPELRLPAALYGAIATVVGLLWFGYTSYSSIHWIVSILGSAVYGFGALTVLLSTFNYIIDTYLHQGAKAFAAVGLIRSIFTSVFPLFGTAFYTNLGPRNATLVLACIALLEIAIPLIGMRYGQRIRKRSRIAVCKE